MKLLGGMLCLNKLSRFCQCREFGTFHKILWYLVIRNDLVVEPLISSYPEPCSFIKESGVNESGCRVCFELGYDDLHSGLLVFFRSALLVQHRRARRQADKQVHTEGILVLGHFLGYANDAIPVHPVRKFLVRFLLSSPINDVAVSIQKAISVVSSSPVGHPYSAPKAEYLELHGWSIISLYAGEALLHHKAMRDSLQCN
mmetsp:Transcript_14632/g.42100  ORF Transcript_14632/g.42100 Transcript_14632/m.42100 type:complete len:200 (+) Transcript_14632:951-1550(+)